MLVVVVVKYVYLMNKHSVFTVYFVAMVDPLGGRVFGTYSKGSGKLGV